MAPSCAASTWRPRARRPRVGSGSCSRTSRRTGPRRICSPRWVRPWRRSRSSAPSHRPDHRRARHDHGRPPIQVIANKDHNDALSENPNPLLTSGFTFVGQFVDHDITFDTTTLDQQQSDPYATTNFRVPRYDLDSIYGLGPSKHPQFYDPADRDKFLIVKRPYSDIRGVKLKTPGVVYDVPRDAAGKAIIADPRNDQTLIVLQIHVALQMFHNKLVDYMRAIRVPRAAVFESARRLARWHYQWMVTHDFLPAIVGKAMMDSVYKEVLTGVPIINIKYYKPMNPLGRPFIPVEFSVAAYRFGHSIARPRYTVQDFINSAGGTVAVSSVPLFSDTEPSRQQVERVPRAAGSDEAAVEQVLQQGGVSRPPGPCASSTPVCLMHCSSCRRRRCPIPTPRAGSRCGTSFGAGRWACPRASRWLG